MIKFTPDVCPCCTQTTNYLLAIDRGTVNIVKKIALFIGSKGINIVHPRNEMEGHGMTSNEVGNLTRARAHGLIAAVPGNPGNYCLTTKGAEFLKGAIVPQFAIRDKVSGRTTGYYDEGRALVSVHDFDQSDEYWEGIGYDIVAGRVVTPDDLTTSEPQTLFQ